MEVSGRKDLGLETTGIGEKGVDAISLNRVISAIKMVTAMAVAGAGGGCASSKSVESPVNSAADKCLDTGSDDKDEEEIDPKLKEMQEQWIAIVGEYNLSTASSELLWPVFFGSEKKALPAIQALLTNKNRSLPLFAAYSEKPIIEYTVISRAVLTHENLDAAVYFAMGRGIQDENDQVWLLRAMNSKSFNGEVFAREYEPTWSSDIEFIASVFENPSYNERIFTSVRRIAAIPFGRYSGFKNEEINKLARKLALDDPQVLYDYEESLWHLRRSHKIRSDYGNLVAFDYLSELLQSNASVEASTLAKQAVLMNQPEDHSDVLRELKPIVASQKMTEVQGVVRENIRNKSFIELLGGAIQNPEFEVAMATELLNAASQCGEYAYVLASYLQHQDLKHWMKALRLVKKYSKYKKAEQILSDLAAYFSSEAFDFKRVREVAALAQKDDKSSFHQVFEKSKCDGKVIKFAKRLVDETREPDEDNSDRQNAIDALATLLEKDQFHTWMLDYSLTHGHAAQTVNYLNVVLDKAEVKNIPSYDRAVELACELKLRCDDPIIYANIAYGIAVYGEEKVKKLNQQYGIRFFSRYRKKILEKMLSSAPRRKMPLIAFFTVADWNGAFADDDILRKFEDRFDITVVETGSETDVFRWLESMNRGLAVIGAHGFEKSIHIGRGSSEKAVIDGNDKSDMRKLSSVPPQIILNSCETGKNDKSIGAQIARAMNTQVFAPKKPSSLISISLDGGKVVSVEYAKSDTSVFDFRSE